MKPVKFNTRRQFMKTGLATVGALGAGTQSSDAFLFFKGSSNLDTDNLPKEWVRQNEEVLFRYARHLSSLRLKNLTVQNVIAAHAKVRGSCWNQLPPESLWAEMDPTLKAADQLSQALGVGLDQVVSAYRSPAYNSRCPGAKSRSYHMRNQALDLIFKTKPSRVARVAREMRNNGAFSGGVGSYSNFTHIDTRGYSVDWKG